MALMIAAVANGVSFLVHSVRDQPIRGPEKALGEFKRVAIGQGSRRK
jgi:hypothetical protein